MLAKAAVLSIDFEAEKVSVDFFSASKEHPDPSILAEAFADSIRGDFPNREIVVVQNATSLKTRLKKFGLE